MIYLKTTLYEFDACMKYAILIKEKKKLDIRTKKKLLIYKHLSELLTIKYFQKTFNYY